MLALGLVSSVSNHSIKVDKDVIVRETSDAESRNNQRRNLL